MKLRNALFGAALLATPAAPQGCATIGIGVSYHGKYADYSAIRTHESGRAPNWNVLVTADGKQIREPGR